MITVRSVTPFFKHVSPKTVWTFVRVVADDGTEGWGEATVNGRAAAVGSEIQRQHAALAGTRAVPAEGVRPLTLSKVGWAAASAIDQALWDIFAQREGMPLAAMLSGTTSYPRHADAGRHPRLAAPTEGKAWMPTSVGMTVSHAEVDVPLYANINRGTLDRSPLGFAATAAAAVDAGFTAIKMAPFDDLTPENAGTVEGMVYIQAGLDRIAAAQDAIGSGVKLMVDCHWRFTPATAEAALREAARIGISWFECPLLETSETIADVRKLRGIANAAGMQLAGMEEFSTVEAFLPWVDAYDVMMPDVKYAGGLSETFRIAEALRARGVGVSLHNPTGSVCHAASLHVSAALRTGLPLEIQWAETDLLFDLPSVHLPRPRNGHSPLPSGNGHGARLSVDDLTS